MSEAHGPVMTICYLFGLLPFVPHSPLQFSEPACSLSHATDILGLNQSCGSALACDPPVRRAFASPSKQSPLTVFLLPLPNNRRTAPTTYQNFFLFPSPPTTFSESNALFLPHPLTTFALQATERPCSQAPLTLALSTLTLFLLPRLLLLHWASLRQRQTLRPLHVAGVNKFASLSARALPPPSPPHPPTSPPPSPAAHLLHATLHLLLLPATSH
jgi:hypothetical protein